MKLYFFNRSIQSTLPNRFLLRKLQRLIELNLKGDEWLIQAYRNIA